MSAVTGIYLIPYALTGCNLRVGKFDVSASNMILFGFNMSSSTGKWTVETHKAFATYKDQYTNQQTPSSLNHSFPLLLQLSLT